LRSGRPCFRLGGLFQDETHPELLTEAVDQFPEMGNDLQAETQGFRRFVELTAPVDEGKFIQADDPHRVDGLIHP